jgi:hypothetical protein
MCLKHIPGCETKHETPRYGIQEGADSNKLVIIGTISLLGLVIAMPDGEFGRRNFRSISSFSSTGWLLHHNFYKVALHIVSKIWKTLL